MAVLNSVNEPGRLADLIASNLRMRVEEAQRHPGDRPTRWSACELVNEQLVKEAEVASMQHKIQSMAKEGMDKAQKDFFLREQMKAIRKELGEGGEESEEIDELKRGPGQGRHAQGRQKGGGQAAQAPRPPCIPTPPRPRRHPHLPGLDGGAALEKAVQGPPGHQGSQAHPRRGPLRPGKGQGAHPGIPVGAQAEPQDEGPHPVLRGASGRGQDLAWPVHRPGPGPQVRAHVPGRHARRGRNPRPPAHLHRFHARPHRPGHQAPPARATR